MFTLVKRTRSLARLKGNLQTKSLEPVWNLLGQTANFCSEAPAGPNIATIAKGDKELEHKLKVLALEVEVMRQEGQSVPEIAFLKDNHWQELLKFPTWSARRRYLEFLFKVSKKRENEQAKKEKRKADWEQNKVERVMPTNLEEFVSSYNLQNNNIFLRFYDSTMNQMYNNKLIQAMQFGQKLVLDCGYDEKMTNRENSNCAKQLMLLFSENRYHDEPFDLHFCNTNPESTLMQVLHRFIPTMYEPSFPLNIHQPSYLDLFPKEQLVYLTPHCREELVEYDHDAIYIIGAIVDKMNNEPLSLAKAKKEGIKMAKLPLDRHLSWGAGSGKCLTLNHVTSIMLDVKMTGDWKFALRHVPKRKLTDYTQQNQNFDSIKPRDRSMPTWTPSANSNFKKPNINKKDKDRISRVRSIMYD